MAFTVCVWNVQRMTENTRDYKQGVVEQWIGQENPDLLGLIEVGSGYRLEGYEYVNHVETRTANFEAKPTQLCIMALQRDGSAIEVKGARTLRGGEDQKRAQLKVNVKHANAIYSIYFLHATANTDGGIGAADHAVSMARVARRLLVAGDFNYDLRLDHKRLDISNRNDIQVLQGQNTGGANMVKTHKKDGILDFGVASADLNIQPKPVKRYLNWRTIDHCPVMFRVQ